MDETVENDADIPPEVHPNRRAFVKRVVAVTAFSVPMIASYDLHSLSESVAQAGQSNQTS